MAIVDQTMISHLRGIKFKFQIKYLIIPFSLTNAPILS